MTMPALLSHFGINTRPLRHDHRRDRLRRRHEPWRTLRPHHPRLGHSRRQAHLPRRRREAGPRSRRPHGLVGRQGSDRPPHRRDEDSFPDWVYVPPENGWGPCWGGIIDTGRGKFKVGILLRRDEGLPRVVVFDRRLGAPAGHTWQRSPHLYDNDNLCVADLADWNPAEHTAATAAGWAAHWLAAYTEWRMSREWPVEGVHAVAS